MSTSKMAKLKKRVEEIEKEFPADDESFSVDWELLTPKEQEIITAGARVELKYRVSCSRYGGSKFDFSNITVEDKATRMLAQAVMSKHLEKKSEIQKRYMHPYVKIH